MNTAGAMTPPANALDADTAYIDENADGFVSSLMALNDLVSGGERSFTCSADRTPRLAMLPSALGPNGPATGAPLTNQDAHRTIL